MYLKHMLIVYALEDYINWNICTIIILNEHKKAWYNILLVFKKHFFVPFVICFCLFNRDSFIIFKNNSGYNLKGNNWMELEWESETE